MSNHELAKEAAILLMLERFLMAPKRDISGPLGVLLASVKEYPAEPVIAACEAFKCGELTRDHRFHPNAVEFLIQVKRFSPPEPNDPEIGKYTGHIDADYGYGRIDMRRMTRAEVELVDRDPHLRKVLANKPRPELLLRDKAAMITNRAQPKLQRMAK